MKKIEVLVKKLIDTKKTISTMESCTGGELANAITDCTDSSKIFKFGAVTYSNEYKIKMGVDKKIIDKFTVYSTETAKSMSKCISQFTDSDYGIGITGKLKKFDETNPHGEDDIVFVAIYDKMHDNFYELKLKVPFEKRAQNKKYVIDKIASKLSKIIN